MLGGCLSHDLSDREIRGALAVRDAASDEHTCFLAQRFDQLPRQACLADPGLTDDGHHAAVLVGAGVRVYAPQPLELPLAADERRVEAAGVRRRIRKDLVEAPGPVNGLGPDGIADELIGLVTEQNATDRRARFELRRHARCRA